MATFNASGHTSGIRFDLFNVADLISGTAQISSPTDFIIGPSMSAGTIFNGSGFTYSGGLFNGGTINRIESFSGSDSLFVIEGIAMPVAQFRGFVISGNSQGFLAAVLAGNDTVTGSKFDDYLQGFAGNDFLIGDQNPGGGNDTLNGGLGADTMAGNEGDDFYFVDNAKDFVQGETDIGGTETIQSSVSYVLGLNLEHLFLTGAAALTGTGNDLANQIVGNAGANFLQGLGASDSLDGGAGNDKLDGGTGDDVMLGGAGNDVYTVDSATDQVTESIAGKAGGLDIVFSAADITLGANIENATLIGLADITAHGNDLNNVILAKNDGLGTTIMFGEAGNDTIVGSADNNILNGGAGADKLSGGGGDDSYIIDDADKVAETLSGLKGGEDLVGYQGTIGYTLGANLENLSLVNSNGATFGIGNNLGNQINGNLSDNTLDGKTGADTMRGSGGNDIYVVDNTLDIIDEVSFSATGVDTVRSSIDFNLNDNGTTVLGEIEHLVLLGKALTGTGNSLGNQITGNAGKNSLSGLDGNDTLDGGAGNDTLAGGSGSDVYVVDNKLDLVFEDGADLSDQIKSSKISVDISAVELSKIENIELLGTLALSATGNAADNIIIGNAGANKLFGSGGVDTLFGGDGNDTLDGGIGLDSLVGGAGNDVYIIDHTLPGILEIVDESGGSGIDTVISSASSFNLGTEALGIVENLILASGAGNINAIGSPLADVITGNEGDNLIQADLGADTVNGGAGNDTVNGNQDNDSIDGGAGNDSVTGDSGNDTMAGGLGDDTLRGGVGIDSIDGGAGNDSIVGDSGNDTIIGGLGDDKLEGGEDDDTINVAAGNDVVKFNSVLDGHDLIVGFDGNPLGGQDKIDLTALFDNLVVPPDQRSSRVAILDYGSTVDIRINADNDLSNGYELTVATIQTNDAVTIGQDVLLV